VRRVAPVLAAAAALVAGCDSDDDPQRSPAPREVTRVQVVEGIGRQGGFDAGQIYDRLSPGVVTVISVFDGGVPLLEDDGEGGQGSGFVVDGRGQIATNAHVVTSEAGERAEEVYVEFSELLEVDPEGLSLTPLQLGRSNSIEVGEPVAAIGSPFGERQSLSVGVISAVDRNIESLTRFQIGDAIQTDAAINPGNSGGPLLDARGRVLGINAQIKSQSGGGEGVGFAIPVDAVRRSLAELRASGRVDYGYLGVSTLSLWPQLAERLDLDVDAGALVQEVEPDSPAKEVGLRAGSDEIEFQATPVQTGGDVIVAVDGRRLSRTDDLADQISAMSAGEEVELELLRDGRRRTIRVELGRRPRGSD
jgi:S1-C subfamily serine protease